MSIEKRIVEAPYMTSALRREAAEEITRLRNALAQSVKIGAEHREGRLKALEWMAALESRLREIGDLAASCRTGPALREAMAQIETMTDMRHNVGIEPPKVGSNDGLGAEVDDAIHGASETGNMGARLSRAE